VESAKTKKGTGRRFGTVDLVGTEGARERGVLGGRWIPGGQKKKSRNRGRNAGSEKGKTEARELQI